MSIALPVAPSFGAPIDQRPCPEFLSFLATRRSASAVTLAAPGPDEEEVAALIRLAARVPDHGKLAPWRFIVLEGDGKAVYAQYDDHGETKVARIGLDGSVREIVRGLTGPALDRPY